MKSLITILFCLTLKVCLAQISDFTGTDVQSGDAVKLSSYSGKKGVVVIFTSNVCPYSVYYEGRITQLISEFGDQVQFILVNSHKDEKESEKEMKNKIDAWGITVPYVADKGGKIKASFGARKSPEVFVIRPGSSSWTVFYKGAIDNNPQVATDVKDQYLKRNIENLIAGKGPAIASTRPIGCMIK